MPLQRISAHDTFKTTSRTITDEGYLKTRANIARTGIQSYRAYELGLDNVPPMKIIRLYRSPEEVFDGQSMKSFDGKPITVDHPTDMVNSSNWKDLSVGDAVNIGRDGIHMQADLTIKDKAGIEALDAGKQELSNGYTFDLDMTPGTSPNGEAYDGLQKNIRGNHIALVDAARCGSACRIGDSQPKPVKEKTMAQKVVVDGIPLELGDTEAAMVNKLVTEREKAAKDAAALAETHKSELAAKDKEIDTLKTQVMTPAARDAMVAEWAGVLENVRKLVPKISTDGKTCHALRKEALTFHTTGDGKSAAAPAILAVLGGVAIDAADESTTKTAFNVLVSQMPKGGKAGKGNDAAIVGALLGADGKAAMDPDDDEDADPDDDENGEGKSTGDGKPKKPKLHGRDAFLARQRDAYRK